ncbi:NeuD/PglB/VioB family sugar acetyltransferase [Inediibacterium massiliense]|uniref:NeuD/PglB/VioB family sugar acetyltransferase n=1 Tax=Inediibacterium massiliense TaxID=1658111 RepID=UPI0006B5FCD8|nr:NeuD/PglB/VioB family sugar acetyltransferase [Inediibacterium massiliense]
MYWNGIPTVIFGSGGISKEVFHLIEEINSQCKMNVFDFLGFVDNDKRQIGKEIIDRYKIVTNDEEFEEFTKEYPILGVVIPIGNPKVKKNIYHKIKDIKNIIFPNIIHPNVVLNRNTIFLGQGNVITSGVKLTCNIELGNFNLLNLNCTVGHDVKIGNFNIINPGSNISGNVTITDQCLIGTGAQILQGITIKNNTTIGAGAVVIKDVKEKDVVVGVPAKSIIKRY